MIIVVNGVSGMIVFEIAIENKMLCSLFYRLSVVLGIVQQFPKTECNTRLTDRLARKMLVDGKIVVPGESLLTRIRNAIVAQNCANVRFLLRVRSHIVMNERGFGKTYLNTCIIGCDFIGNEAAIFKIDCFDQLVTILRRMFRIIIINGLRHFEN